MQPEPFTLRTLRKKIESCGVLWPRSRVAADSIRADRTTVLRGKSGISRFTASVRK